MLARLRGRVVMREPRFYRLVAEIVYEAAHDDAAGMIAAELVALPLEHESVWSTEGDYYEEASSDPLNLSTYRMTSESRRG